MRHFIFSQAFLPRWISRSLWSYSSYWPSWSYCSLWWPFLSRVVRTVRSKKRWCKIPEKKTKTKKDSVWAWGTTSCNEKKAIATKRTLTVVLFVVGLSLFVISLIGLFLQAGVFQKFWWFGYDILSDLYFLVIMLVVFVSSTLLTGISIFAARELKDCNK